MQKFGQALGEALGLGIGLALAKIIIIFVFGVVIIGASGVVFLGLSFYFYKKKKPKSFLFSAAIGDISLSLIAALILSSKISGNLSLFMVLAPVFLIIGGWVAWSKYRKLKSAGY